MAYRNAKNLYRDMHQMAKQETATSKVETDWSNVSSNTATYVIYEGIEISPAVHDNGFHITLPSQDKEYGAVWYFSEMKYAQLFVDQKFASGEWIKF